MTEPTATVGNGKAKKLSFDGYNPKGDSLSALVMDCLLWVRSKYPGALVAHTEIAQRIHKYKRLPSKVSKEVAAVKSACTRIRPLMLTQHKLSMVAVAGRGVRLTTDADDQARYGLRRRVKVTDTAIRNQNAEADAIDTVKVKDPLLKQFVVATKAEMPKLTSYANRIKNILEPKKEPKK